MQTARRALVLGVAFGMGATLVELCFQGMGTVQRRFGPGPGFLVPTALFEIALGALIGALGS